MIRIVKPYSVVKNLGQAYNQAMHEIPDNSWACLCDLDTAFLTPDAGQILWAYTERFPNTGIFTCFTNRLHTLAFKQLLNGVCSENTNMKDHIRIAEDQKKNLYQVTEIKHEISGFLMMVKKETWNKIKFPEIGKCLGVDNIFSTRILEAGKNILRMDGLYVWHSYRLANGVLNKDHLR